MSVSLSSMGLTYLNGLYVAMVRVLGNLFVTNGINAMGSYYSVRPTLFIYVSRIYRFRLWWQYFTHILLVTRSYLILNNRSWCNIGQPCLYVTFSILFFYYTYTQMSSPLHHFNDALYDDCTAFGEISCEIASGITRVNTQLWWYVPPSCQHTAALQYNYKFSALFLVWFERLARCSPLPAFLMWVYNAHMMYAFNQQTTTSGVSYHGGTAPCSHSNWNSVFSYNDFPPLYGRTEVWFMLGNLCFLELAYLTLRVLSRLPVRCEWALN